MEKHRPYNNSLIKEARQRLRKNLPSPELILWSKLKQRQLNGFKFRRQYGIDNYIVDFYCPSCRLAIEIDGDSHYTKRGRQEDSVRDKNLNIHGIQVLRFTNLEINNNCDGVLVKIADYLEGHTTPGPS
ncbi:DNA methyltransferase [Candidatus Berkelbacteria bacterium CG10_big_fil_rev_8_21_14_0_10_43_13]|uniref:DNA methyltransferase n=1 Tax=Candidatus Berkelbacteria bacterium CG10_big_fil_rev_8_21_14_0_10_43_13 TaxID=1974514 RepID=A0A2H0W799_9BACT|nr:MAG: DNA methyltransferase [Candidatus Berkelbacteria bacterium CG10_big_fil_rev_8_21_14_0_10_43_13]